MKTIKLSLTSDPTFYAADICASLEKALGVRLHVVREHGDTLHGHVNTSSEGCVELVLYEPADVQRLQAFLAVRGMDHQIDVAPAAARSADALKAELAGILAQRGFIPIL